MNASFPAELIDAQLTQKGMYNEKISNLDCLIDEDGIVGGNEVLATTSVRHDLAKFHYPVGKTIKKKALCQHSGKISKCAVTF